MKRLLFLLLALSLTGIGVWSCGDKPDKPPRDCEVTIVCRESGKPDGVALKSVTVSIPMRTFVNEKYLTDNSLIPEIAGYYYSSFHGPATTLNANKVTLTLYYGEILPDDYMLTVHFRDAANLDGEELKASMIIAVARQTTIDSEWLSNKEWVQIEGYDISSLAPATQTMDADRTLTLLYEKQRFDITVRYRERNGNPDVPLADDFVVEGVEWGTVVDRAYLEQAEAVKSIAYYNFREHTPATFTVTGAATVTMLYAPADQRVTMRYGDIDAPLGTSYLTEHRHPDIPFGTVVNEAYLRANGHIVEIAGYRFEVVVPEQMTVVSSGNNIIDLRYRRIYGTLTVEYLRVTPDGGASVLCGSQEHSLPTGTVIKDYDYLLANEMIDPALIPHRHSFDSMTPLGATVVEAGTTVRLYYKPDDVEVTIVYWNENRVITAVETVGIPYGTAIEGYQDLVNRGYVNAEKVPEEHIFDRMTPDRFTVTEQPVEVNLYYESGLRSVIIEYYEGLPAQVGTKRFGEAEVHIMLGTVIRSYQDLLDGGYIDPAKIPAGTVFAAMRPAGGVTVVDGGVKIELYFVVEEEDDEEDPPAR